MKTDVQRLNTIMGQLEGIKAMMTDNKSDCVQILTQLKAVKAAVASVMDSMIESQFNNCLPSVNKKDKQLLIKIKNYVKSN